MLKNQNLVLIVFIAINDKDHAQVPVSHICICMIPDIHNTSIICILGIIDIHVSRPQHLVDHEERFFHLNHFEYATWMWKHPNHVTVNIILYYQNHNSILNKCC